MHPFLEGQHYKILKRAATPRTNHSSIGIFIYFCICNSSLFLVHLVHSYQNKKRVKSYLILLFFLSFMIYLTVNLFLRDLHVGLLEHHH